jgi:hypothetical protein
LHLCQEQLRNVRVSQFSSCFSWDDWLCESYTSYTRINYTCFWSWKHSPQHSILWFCNIRAVKKKISIFVMYIPCEASSWTLLHQNRKLSSRISLQNQLFWLCRLPAVLSLFSYDMSYKYVWVCTWNKLLSFLCADISRQCFF